MNIDEKTGLSSSDLNVILGQLKAYPSIVSAYIFGSRAKGNYKTGSDIDLALQGEDLIRSDLADLSYHLNQESLLPYHLDILNMNTADKNVVDHIKRVGVQILSSD